ncbi:MAG: hypothetical protein K9K67_08585 [Bacteriovoracaceae bacterium]|nr:hypothetical protein [Bacteriovoracaceae bacterium]
MDLEFLMNLNELPSWRILKKEVLTQDFPMYRLESAPLGSHELVYVLVDESEQPKTFRVNESDVDSFAIFTRPELVTRLQKAYKKEDIQGGKTPAQDLNLGQVDFSLKIMMLGQLMNILGHKGKETTVKVNPILVEVGAGIEPLVYAEEVLFAPQYDAFTGKLLLSNPEDAKALLALNPEDQKRFGIEIVFYMMTTRELPEEKEERQQILKDEIEKLSFMASRVPMKRGSGSFLAVLINLENELEEQAFIREYPMFDSYSDIIFVTSSLKLLTGRLEEVHYNGSKIDTIFGPLIKWQQSKSLQRSKFY